MDHVFLDPREVKPDGGIIVLQRCVRCQRDFGQGLDGIHRWEAVYAGVFRVERLAESVTTRWLSERCPDRRLPEDDDLRAMRMT